MSSKFTRSGIHRGGEPAKRPQHTPYRVYGEKVAVGEPFQIQGDTEIREEIQTSLEFLAKQHLLEAEEEGNKLIAKARLEATEILKKANAQSKELLQQVQGQVDSIRESAHEEGFKAGFQEGYTDATEHVERETTELLKEANTLVEAAYQAEKQVLKQFEKQAVALIRHLVQRIVQRELTDTPDSLMTMVQHAIESLYLSGKVQVVVSTQIIQDLRDYSIRTQESLDSTHRFEFIADPNLDVHQLYIIGQEGCFDLSPDTQMKHLIAPLEDQLVLPRPELITSDLLTQPESAQNIQTEQSISESDSEIAIEIPMLDEPAPMPSPEMPIEIATDAQDIASALPTEDPTGLSSELIDESTAVTTEPALEESLAPEVAEALDEALIEATPYQFPAFDEAGEPPLENPLDDESGAV